MKICTIILLFYFLEPWDAYGLPVADPGADQEALPHSQDYYAGYIKAIADNYDTLFSPDRDTRSTDTMENVSNQENKKDNNEAKPETVGQQQNANSAPSPQGESVASESNQKVTTESSNQDANQDSNTTSTASTASKSEASQYGSDTQTNSGSLYGKDQNQDQINPSLSDSQAKTPEGSSAQTPKEEHTETSSSDSANKDQVQAYPGDHNQHTEPVGDTQSNESDTKTEEPATPAAAGEKNETRKDIQGEAVNQTSHIENFMANRDEEEEEEDEAESGSGGGPVKKQLVATFTKGHSSGADLETSRDIHHYDGNQELEDMRKRNSDDAEEEDTKAETDPKESDKASQEDEKSKRGDMTNSTSKVISGSYASYKPGNPQPTPNEGGNQAGKSPVIAPQPQQVVAEKPKEKSGAKKSAGNTILVGGTHHKHPLFHVDSEPVNHQSGYVLEHTYGDAPLFGGLQPYSSSLYMPFNYGVPMLYGNPHFAYPISSATLGDEDAYFDNSMGKKEIVPTEEKKGEEIDEDSKANESEDEGDSDDGNDSDNGQKYKPGIILLGPPHGMYEYGIHDGCACGCGCGCNCGCGCGCNCGCQGKNNKNGKNDKNQGEEQAFTFECPSKGKNRGAAASCGCVYPCGCKKPVGHFLVGGPVHIFPHVRVHGGHGGGAGYGGLYGGGNGGLGGIGYGGYGGYGYIRNPFYY